MHVIARLVCTTVALCVSATAGAGDNPPAAESHPDSKAQPQVQVLTTASVLIDSAELDKLTSIPIINSRVLKFSVSTFEGCPADVKQFPVTTEVSHGKLSPKTNSTTVTVPVDKDIAVFAEYTNASGGNSISCERALRFHSEPAKSYHVHYVLPRPWHIVSCGMTIVETRDGTDVPVPSAHDALLGNRGFGNWRGLSNMNVCAERDALRESKTP